MAQRNSGLVRDPLNFYSEPRWCAELLLAAECFHGQTWDPCCGNGTIPRVFRAAGLECLATDVKKRGGWVEVEMDFLSRSPAFAMPAIDNIVFNPPYSRETVRMLERALVIARSKVAALLPISFLASSARFELYTEHSPPARVYILSSRPSMPPGVLLDPESGRFNCDDQLDVMGQGAAAMGLGVEPLAPRWKRGDEPHSGSVDFCWIVWSRDHERSSGVELRWLRRDLASRPTRGGAHQESLDLEQAGAGV